MSAAPAAVRRRLRREYGLQSRRPSDRALRRQLLAGQGSNASSFELGCVNHKLCAERTLIAADAAAVGARLVELTINGAARVACHACGR